MNGRFARLMSGLAFSIALGSTSSFAQAPPPGIEEIVVVAQKREQVAQDIGIAVAAFSGRSLQERGVDQPEDLYQLIPNVNLQNNGGGGAFFQSFKRDFKEWAGSASIIHKPTGLFVWAGDSNSENNDIGAKGVYTGKAPPVMHAWDVAGGVSKNFFGPGATTMWGGYTKDQDGLGGFTRTTISSSVSGTASSYAVWDGEVSAGAFPGIPFLTEATSSETTKWYLAVDQAIDSAAMNVFIAYQHIDPEMTLVTQCDEFGVCGASSQRDYSTKGKLKKVPLTLDDFDVLFMGGRIQF